MEVSGHLHAPADLLAVKVPVPTEPRSRSGRFEEEKLLPLPELEKRIFNKSIHVAGN